jgi:hypothetical protein
MYTPARSTWGVFQRPRDISKVGVGAGGAAVRARCAAHALSPLFQPRTLVMTLPLTPPPPLPPATPTAATARRQRGGNSNREGRR